MNRSDHNHAEDGEELHDDGAPGEEQDWLEDSDDDGQEELIEQDCMRCEETFAEPAHNDYCPKCRRNMNRIRS